MTDAFSAWAEQVAGVTLKSYTDRVLASVEQGFSGVNYHCE